MATRRPGMRRRQNAVAGFSPRSLLLWSRSSSSVVLGCRIRTAALRKSFLCSTRVCKHADQAVIALVASSFIDLIRLIVVFRQLLDGCPWFSPRRWILDRHL